MVVKIRIPKQGKGDEVVECELEEAQKEVEEASKNGYIPTYEGRAIGAGDVREGQELRFYPMGRGG